ncbi:hypothetical protein Sp245p_03530 [Azospirillum baldaniorum]|uniref:Uncharacterized protein n=1 Tax=Azospirillum baldaniorum TaxID=1064539 RepID=A0A9P1NN15_9PROT|nr:hypothetical protein [Azospirillum baldaniorum]AWJ88925.1 hypothetical protein Sp245p_03530 [Azospirillum baldaniorum]TWA73363.1 hypothetical protein FBZ85_11655 [Azospirillum brasilense]CCC99362.1 conserved protein of unknown function [Azospirillum baldaniorum]
MIDEGKLRLEEQRGAQAQALLDNDLLREAFAGLRQDYMRAWEATGARETDARERLWQAVQIVGKVESHLRSVAQTGQLAQRQINDIQGKKSPFQF